MPELLILSYRSTEHLSLVSISIRGNSDENDAFHMNCGPYTSTLISPIEPKTWYLQFLVAKSKRFNSSNVPMYNKQTSITIQTSPACLKCKR